MVLLVTTHARVVDLVSSSCFGAVAVSVFDETTVTSSSCGDNVRRWLRMQSLDECAVCWILSRRFVLFIALCKHPLLSWAGGGDGSSGLKMTDTNCRGFSSHSMAKSRCGTTAFCSVLSFFRGNTLISISQSINQFNSNLAAREPDSK